MNSIVDKNVNEFIDYLASRSLFKPDNLFFDSKIIEKALIQTHSDVLYHYKNVSIDDLIPRIVNNYSELPLFLFRFGNTVYNVNNSSKSLDSIHFLMKDICSCELYFSNQIAEGLYVQHGLGTVIGSRNTIGKGFRIFQNCTIGHRSKSSKGNIIGNNVICYAGAKIIGENKIGDNTIIGANAVVTKDIPPNMVVHSSPLEIKVKSSETTIL